MQDLSPRLSFQPVVDQDFEAMLGLRIHAMRPSPERVGRFDINRSRERLSDGFVIPFMHHIVLDGDQRVGFVTLKPEGTGALRLDHLCLRTGFQSMGIGGWVLAWAMTQAHEKQCDIKLAALFQSDANRFCPRHDFVLEGEDSVDVHYRWRVRESVC